MTVSRREAEPGGVCEEPRAESQPAAATTALRRLHYRATRRHAHSQVAGAAGGSSTSNTTSNNSTDSVNTALTSVTSVTSVTSATVTDDSLDAAESPAAAPATAPPDLSGPARFDFEPPGPPGERRRSACVRVTPNPLDSSAAPGRTTIVVQQPSLSLEYGGCATVLAAGGGGRHARSHSVKAARQLLGPPPQRARVASMPNTGASVEEEYYRLRHFSITGKGVVNRGDSLRSRRSRSNTSVASTDTDSPSASSRDSSAGPGGACRVLVLGAPGVGKSSLVGQFMTSEHLHAYDTSVDDESGERSVCVLLAGEETEVTFVDEASEAADASEVTASPAHGYCVVYSSSDRGSFLEAERRLQALWAEGATARRAVILVANKADLARSRLVTGEEGKALATSYECKFIETSVGINHNVDELLVGLVAQIRLRRQEPRRPHRAPHRAAPPTQPPAAAAVTPALSPAGTPRRRTRLSASVKVRGLLGRVWPRDTRSKSCENLHVL